MDRVGFKLWMLGLFETMHGINYRVTLALTVSILQAVHGPHGFKFFHLMLSTLVYARLILYFRAKRPNLILFLSHLLVSISVIVTGLCLHNYLAKLT